MSTSEDMEPSNTTELLLQAQRRISALEERLAALEGPSSPTKPALADDLAGVRASLPVVSMEEVSTRRGLFRVAGAVATAAVAHNVLSASPAAAANGGNLILGQANDATSDTSLTKNSNGGAALIATNTSTSALADGVRGVSDSNLGAGVAGSSTNGYGVYGATTTGYAIYSAGRLGMAEHLQSQGTPASGTYALGDLFRDNVGNIYACVVAGSAQTGVAQFRKIAGPSTAGQFHMLNAPMRVYDSRPGSGAASGGQGAITNGVTRVVSLASGRVNGALQVAVPAGATGAMCTITLAETQSGGYLSVYSNAVATWPGHSSMNWFGSSQVLANTVVTAVDSSQQIKVLCGGQSTQFIVDVVGYYR